MNALTRRRHQALRRTALVLAFVYLLALSAIAFWPTPVDRDASGSITGVLAWLHAHGVPGWVNYALVEFTANIALFVPVGLLGVILLGARNWWLAILAGCVTSGYIEFTQLVFLPARFATPQDVLANTLGAALGALLGVLLLAAVSSRARAQPVPAV